MSQNLYDLHTCGLKFFKILSLIKIMVMCLMSATTGTFFVSKYSLICIFFIPMRVVAHFKNSWSCGEKFVNSAIFCYVSNLAWFPVGI